MFMFLAFPAAKWVADGKYTQRPLQQTAKRLFSRHGNQSLNSGDSSGDTVARTRQSGYSKWIWIVAGDKKNTSGHCLRSKAACHNLTFCFKRSTACSSTVARECHAKRYSSMAITRRSLFLNCGQGAFWPAGLLTRRACLRYRSKKIIHYNFNCHNYHHCHFIDNHHHLHPCGSGLRPTIIVRHRHPSRKKFRRL